MQDALGAAHFPQHVYVDRSTRPGNIIGALHLRNAAANAIFDKFFMALGTGTAGENLGDDIAIIVIAVGVDGRDGADTAGRCPCSRTCVICNRYTFATLDQRPNFATAIDDGLQTLEHVIPTPNNMRSWRAFPNGRFASRLPQSCRAKSARRIVAP